MPTTAKNVGVRRGVAGFRHLDQFAGGPRSAMQEFHYFQAWRDVVFVREEFTGAASSAIIAERWVTNTGSGGTAFAIPSTPLVGGAARAATGTDGTASNRIVNMYGAPIYQGDKNCGVEFRFKLDIVTNVAVWMGFLDTITTITTPVAAVSDIDTPAFATGLLDGVLVGFDTAQTLTTMAMAAIGSGALNTGTADAIGVLAPTAATYMTVRIQMSGATGVGNTATALVEDANGSFTVVTRASAMEGGSLVRPFISVSGLNATTHLLDLDYIKVWQDR